MLNIAPIELTIHFYFLTMREYQCRVYLIHNDIDDFEIE